MSKRRHSQNKPAVKSEIEWLNHREGYPAPGERVAIIRMRSELDMKVLELILRKKMRKDPEFRAVLDQYGEQELSMSVSRIQARMDIERVSPDAKERREYRQGFAQYGGSHPYLRAREWQQIQEERGRQFAKHLLEGRALDAFEDTGWDELLINWQNWADITPSAIPPRPADFTCPAPGSYAPPAAELLEYGPNLEKQYDYQDPRWKKAIPALTRMALDPGLLDGWPGENASWAPWHAVHILGLLGAWESAPALVELVDWEEDWLSDHLPHIWADMGSEVTPTLWMILEDKNASVKARTLAAQALFNLAEEDEAVTRLVTRGFEKILANETVFDPTLNAHLISFLNDLDEELVAEAEDTIADAFDAGRVDEDIITFEDFFESDEEDEEL